MVERTSPSYLPGIRVLTGKSMSKTVGSRAGRQETRLSPCSITSNPMPSCCVLDSDAVVPKDKSQDLFCMPSVGVVLCTHPNEHLLVETRRVCLQRV